MLNHDVRGMGEDKVEISTSIIFASQRIPEAENPIPTFGCNRGGIILRPGVTRVLCGAPGDCGGTCHTFCVCVGVASRSLGGLLPHAGDAPE